MTFPSLKWVASVAMMCLAPLSALSAPEALPSFSDNIQLRGNMDNARIRFERQKKGHVAFMGGSITEMNGYRPMVCDILRKRYPDTEFTFTDAGVSSTCSTTGSFRVGTDVLEVNGPVDLFLVEFAVNDDQDAAHTRAECIRGMEGIIRHARRQNPSMDIVVVYFVNESMLQTLQAGKVPLTVESHEAVAAHYGVPSIHLAREVARQITAGTLTWEQYGGVHPAPHGNGIAAAMVDELLNRAWCKPLSDEAAVRAHQMPSKPLDRFNYENGRFIDPKTARIQNGWTLGVPDWSILKGGTRARFTSIPMLVATEPGAEAALEFEGTAVGAYIVAGPDAGVVESSIDGGAYQPVNLYHRFSEGLHYPRTVMLGTELKPGRHTLKLRISSETKSSGHAMRIMQFVAN